MNEKEANIYSEIMSTNVLTYKKERSRYPSSLNNVYLLVQSRVTVKEAVESKEYNMCDRRDVFKPFHPLAFNCPLCAGNSIRFSNYEFGEFDTIMVFWWKSIKDFDVIEKVHSVYIHKEEDKLVEIPDKVLISD